VLRNAVAGTMGKSARSVPATLAVARRTAPTGANPAWRAVDVITPPAKLDPYASTG
jgi:hypothetical protein